MAHQDGPPSDTIEEAVDDEATQTDLPSPGSFGGPPTVEERLSPFHSSGVHASDDHASSGPVSGSADHASGEAAASVPAGPRRVPVPSRRPTEVGMPTVRKGDLGLAPKIVTAPELTPSDGPTRPDGVPVLQAPKVVGVPPQSSDGPTDPQGVDPRGVGAAGGWGSSGGPGFGGPPAPEPQGASAQARWDDASDALTHMMPRRRPPPEVPPQDGPKIEISKSMEMQIAHLDDEPPPDPTEAPHVPAARGRPPRDPAPPTELLLPALKRKEEEGKQEESASDWPIVVGLFVLTLVILALGGAVVLGVMHSMASEPAAEPAAAGSQETESQNTESQDTESQSTESQETGSQSTERPAPEPQPGE